MKIALLFEYATLNGGERSMLAALDWLRMHDASIEFVAMANSNGRLADQLRQRQIELAHWSTFDDKNLRLPQEQIERSLIETVARMQPDLLHANSLSMGRLIGRLSNRLAIPTSSHLRDIIKLSNSAVMELNRNQRLIAVSQATRDFHVAQGLDAERVQVAYNGVDLLQFCPRPATGRLLAELRLAGPIDSKHAHKLILNIGQLGLRKGQNTLVAAAPRIVEQIPGAQFVIVGERNSNKSESIEFERNLREGFAVNGLSDRMHLLGYRADVAALLNEADLLVHTANQEPLGRVLLEGLASGVPIVATDVGGTREIINHQVAGLLIPPSDPDALAAAAIQILSDNALAKRMRTTARRRAESDFSIENAAQNLANIWKAMDPTLRVCFDMVNRVKRQTI